MFFSWLPIIKKGCSMKTNDSARVLFFWKLGLWTRQWLCPQFFPSVFFSLTIEEAVRKVWWHFVFRLSHSMPGLALLQDGSSTACLKQVWASQAFAQSVELIFPELAFYAVDNKHSYFLRKRCWLWICPRSMKFAQNVLTHNKVKPQVPITGSVHVRSA